MSRSGRRAGVAVAAAALLASLVSAPPLVEGSGAPPRPVADALVAAPTGATATRSGSGSDSGSDSASDSGPLAGVRIALDPGHQLGNRNFPDQIGQLVEAGGFRKACNSTGTATSGGYPEATVNFRIARRVEARLEALGAQVFLTRTRNSDSLWGPCVDERGRFGAKVDARLMVSLHADGAASRARGFHVIAPRSRSPWTTDIARPSRRLATALRAGLDAKGIPRSTYIGDGTALSIRSDLGTLNLSDVPVAMLEIGNMRNAGDARRMTSKKGRTRYARAVVRGIRLYLAR